ncbi:MAG: hypothetical protein OXH95_09115 [bacterium]|nr:hypothetical protein [bacterium]MYH55148.1 hypothetical protein [Acidimicrobiia bacterium]
MIFYVRFPAHAEPPPEAVEEIVQTCISRFGSVIGASEDSIDVEMSDQAPVGVMAMLAAELRAAGLPPDTVIAIPSRGQRLGIYEI